MKYSEKISTKLNELLTKNYDAEAGYKEAAENVKNVKLKTYFERRSVERNNFGHAIKNEISSYGETPNKGTSIKSDAHRAWMNLKNFFSGDKEEAMLEEAIRGEKAAVAEYDEILSDPNLPPTTQKMLTLQRNSIKLALDEVKTLELVA